jgi:hypothetical protein
MGMVQNGVRSDVSICDVEGKGSCHTATRQYPVHLFDSALLYTAVL